MAAGKSGICDAGCSGGRPDEFSVGGYGQSAGLASGLGTAGLWDPHAGRGRAGVPVPPSRPEPVAEGRWSLCSHMEFGPLPDTVPSARLRSKVVLHEWGPVLAALAEDTLLVVSELVANAVTASRALSGVRPVNLWLQSDGWRVLVLAGDDSPAPPLRVEPRIDAERGRGLLVVETISSAWGWYLATGRGLAKIVWAQVGPAAPPARSVR